MAISWIMNQVQGDEDDELVVYLISVVMHRVVFVVIFCRVC
ncbi:hypothetical protein PAUR_b0949 [Pseudoalteromonas aurantia 208]|uniref:Uncharacterized protein n=1 Tax=Pseudoalteromonas aurantia 208 TaxID=1314867 RepID=A0ABR9EIN8_9GAMM|nr:hypothetical protein [Pseudoalteromonas aurantia 208]